VVIYFFIELISDFFQYLRLSQNFYSRFDFFPGKHFQVHDTLITLEQGDQLKQPWLIFPQPPVICQPAVNGALLSIETMQVNLFDAILPGTKKVRRTLPVQQQMPGVHAKSEISIVENALAFEYVFHKKHNAVAFCPTIEQRNLIGRIFHIRVNDKVTNQGGKPGYQFLVRRQEQFWQMGRKDKTLPKAANFVPFGIELAFYRVIVHKKQQFHPPDLLFAFKESKVFRVGSRNNP
jgi:hypothetical protein